MKWTDCLILTGLLVVGGAAFHRAEGQEMQADTLFDFEGPEALAGLSPTPAVQVALTNDGVTSGQQALQVTTLAANKGVTDDTRRVFIDPPALIDGSNWTRLAFDATNPGPRDADVYMTLYNPGAHSDWGYDGEGARVPAGQTRTVVLDMRKLGRALRPMLDVSRVSRLGVGAAQRPGEDMTVIIDNIRLQYDPAVGSPTEALKARALQTQQSYQAAIQGVALDRLDPQTQAAARELAARLLGSIAEVIAASETAERDGGFAGKYDVYNKQLYDLAQANEIGKLILLDKPVFYAWQISPYVNIFREEYPTPESRPLERIEVEMAAGELRDTVLQVSNNTPGEQQIAVALESRDKALQGCTLIQEALYFKNVAEQVVGGAASALEGPLVIPQGESRQIRLRFSSKEGGLKGGKHDFSLRLRDAKHNHQQVIAGSVAVWDFTLPDAAEVMSNNVYPEFSVGSLGDLKDLMVRDMRANGLNGFFVHPKELCELDDKGNVVRFTFEKLDQFMSLVMDNWGPGPTPQFFFSLGYGIMPAEAQLGEWVAQFRSIVEGHGVKPENWYFVFGDEATENLLITFELPLGEIMRRAAPGARISSNSSAMIADPELRRRYFATIDRVEPDLDVIKMNPAVLPYFQASGKPMALFRCRGAYSVRGANMYNYYRVYGWEAAAAGANGMGVWTYCGDRHLDPWTDKEEQFTLVFRHPTKRDIVHSRRYEALREGIDDYRLIRKYRDAAAAKGPAAAQAAEKLIAEAVADIAADVNDTTRCDKWRARLADAILKL